MPRGKGAVNGRIAVFSVAEHGMPRRGKLRSDLMRPSGDQPDAEKRKAFIKPGERYRIKLCRLRSRQGLIQKLSRIRGLIFPVILFEMQRALCRSAHNAPVIFFDQSFFKQERQKLLTGKRLSGSHKSARISVQAVCRSRGKSQPACLSALFKIHGNDIIQGNIFRLCLLGQQACRLVRKKDVIIFINDAEF